MIARSRRALAAALGAGLVLASGATGAFDLKGLVEGVTKQATTVWENREVLLGEVDEEQERQMGRAAAAVLLGAAGPVDDERLQSYVGRVGLWVAMHSERPDLDWRFRVLDDDTVNAFATPGGFVFITRGLFMALRNEAELAGVLAHEIAHVTARHHVAAMVAKARTSVLLDVARDASGVRGALPEALLSASKTLYASGLDQGDELEADRTGVVVAARAGYDPWGLRHVLTTLEAAAGDPAMMGLFVSTHPPFASRIEALDAAMAPTLDDLGGETLEEPLGSEQARLR